MDESSLFMTSVHLPILSRSYSVSRCFGICHASKMLDAEECPAALMVWTGISRNGTGKLSDRQLSLYRRL